MVVDMADREAGMGMVEDERSTAGKVQDIDKRDMGMDCTHKDCTRMVADKLAGMDNEIAQKDGLEPDSPAKNRSFASV